MIIDQLSTKFSNWRERERACMWSEMAYGKYYRQRQELHPVLHSLEVMNVTAEEHFHYEKGYSSPHHTIAGGSVIV